MNQSPEVPFATRASECKLRACPPMSKRIIIGMAAAAVLLGNCFAFSAETNEPPTAPTVQVSTNSSASTDEVKSALTLLVARIKAKLQLGKSDESDFADIIKDFDALLAKYPKADDGRLNILFEKGRFYLAATSCLQPSDQPPVE